MGFPHGRVVPPMRKTESLFFSIFCNETFKALEHSFAVSVQMLEKKQTTDRFGGNNTEIVNKMNKNDVDKNVNKKVGQ